jgi:cyclopropane fatty-acyl-phospholipid synthase-like methyltransferase
MDKTINYYNHASELLTLKYETADVSNIHNLLLNTFNQEDKLLEIGCGSGRDTSYMIKNGYDVIGIDGSIKMIEEAKKLHPELYSKLFYKILPNDLDFNDKFDGIYSIATLMHLSQIDLEKTILNIYNLLNTNGKFLMSVSLFRNDINKNGFDEKGRFFLTLSKNEWISVLENNGFKIEDTITNKDGLNRESISWLTIISKKK